MICFRNALKIDSRHYNAWFGLGLIYHRQEHHELAEYHFRKAAKINSINSILQCQLGVVLGNQNKSVKHLEARQILQNACKMDPKNPQVTDYFLSILND